MTITEIDENITRRLLQWSDTANDNDNDGTHTTYSTQKYDCDTQKHFVLQVLVFVQTQAPLSPPTAENGTEHRQ